MKFAKYLCPCPNPLVPRIYGLPKIHKPGNKLRPIISNINAPAYKLAKWILSEFKSLPQPKGLDIKNSFEFIDKIANIKLKNDDILVSFDVVSLYPNVPIPEALKYIDDWLDSCNISDEKAVLYSNITKLCMEQNQFSFNNDFYRLTHGTSMGNPLSCFISNTFMGILETNLKEKGLLPKTWFRYVDDVFSIVKRNEIQNLLEILNSQYPTIQFTVEIESEDHQLPFLDLLLTRSGQKIDVNVFRKSTTTDRYITIDSFSPIQHKMASFNSMVYRMCKLPLSAKNFITELNHIKKVASVNGYYKNDIDKLVHKHSKNIRKTDLSTLYSQNQNECVKRVCFNYCPLLTNNIKTVFRKHKIDIVFKNKKLKNHFISPKDQIDKLHKPGIYKITCIDCDSIYIGQTKRNITTRFKEHIAHIKYNRPTKSAVAQHTLVNNHLNINTSNLELIKYVPTQTHLDAWESLYMHKYRHHLMNTEDEPIRSALFYYTK